MRSSRESLVGRHLWRAAVYVLLLTFTAAPCFAQGSASQSSGADFAATQDDVPEVGFEQRLDAQVPLDLEFKDSTGKTVTLADYFDGEHPVVLALVYYECPMLCGVVLNSLLEGVQDLQYTIGNEYKVLTVSFDPDEGPELAALKKQGYIEQYGRPGAEAGWFFLSGKQPQIDALTQAVGFNYVYDEEVDQFAHSAGLIVLTPDGKVSRYLFGIEYPAKDLRMALLDASENKIGSAIEQLILLCYQYDPESGTYNLVIHRVLQVAGTGTVLVLALVIGMLFRFEKRKRRQEQAVEDHSQPGAAAGQQ